MNRAQSLVDDTVQSGNTYDYRLVGQSGHVSRSTSAAIAAPAVLDRGKVILLVDTNLYAFDPTGITSSVNRLRTNLIGDGWRTVGPFYILRHDDTYDPAHTNLVNRLAQSNILQVLRGEWAANPNDRPKGAILFGHLTIPYSGVCANTADGHGEHGGAWPADMLYGEMDAGLWDIAAMTSPLAQTPFYLRIGTSQVTQSPTYRAFPTSAETIRVADPFCVTSANYPGTETLDCLWGCLAG
jgi:hypothetical protein